MPGIGFDADAVDSHVYVALVVEVGVQVDLDDVVVPQVLVLIQDVCLEARRVLVVPPEAHVQRLVVPGHVDIGVDAGGDGCLVLIHEAEEAGRVGGAGP